MIFHTFAVTVVAVALAGSVKASPCKPASRSTAIHLGTSSIETTTIESLPTTIEALSSVTTALSNEASRSEAAISSTTLTSETSNTVDDTTATISSTIEQTTQDTTTTVNDLSSETSAATDTLTTVEVSVTTTAYTTTDQSAIETATSSSAPHCTFTGEYTNYVQNPSFDNKVNGNWVTTSPWVFLQTPWLAPNSGRDGSNAIAIKYPDGAWSSSILQSLEGVVAGRDYIVRYYWSLQGHPLQSDECRIGASAGPDGQSVHFVYTDGEEPVQQGQFYMQEFRITAEQDDQRLSIGFFCKAGYKGDEVRVNIDDVAVYDYYEGCDSPDVAGAKYNR
ncbi:hypothetical protein FPSE_02239 [Fusarium pseudograminearum CS3096]|uniref:CBM-cenC domain-containing protein n=1 Tax=Fusarium pseudograminearum (strain CS3096) TaxID=1028729 RepID=K3UY89_FUSPC|nr:hypothetical protein FPSE_02239 [Fusarium pseudograminearum CS3096]EKJ77741.1 hypothetical protein FPSE_02239 [Fusarium pseudograminearum CS3096]